MRQNKSWIAGTSILIFALLLTACGGGQSSKSSSNADQKVATTSAVQSNAKEVFEISLNSILGSTHFVATEVLEPWKKMVEEKSGGQLKINLYHGATLGSPTSVLKDVKAGAYEIGYLAPLYFEDTEFFPFSIVTLPFSVTDGKKSAEVITKFTDKYKEEIWRDVLNLGIAGGDSQILISSKPIAKYEDIKNLDIFASNRDLAKLFQIWGAVPVPLSHGEAYESLQKGIIDVAVYPGVATAAGKIYEVGPYINDLKINAPVANFIMNKEFYNKLPEELQNMFLEEFGPALIELHTEAYASRAEPAIKTIEKETGNHQIILSTEERSKFTVPVKEIWNDWIQRANEKGYAGEQMMEDFKKILKDEGIELPF